MCSICVFFFQIFLMTLKYLNPSGMICNFSNFQHGAHHGGCTCDVTGGITGAYDITGGVTGVSPLPNLHNLQSIT